MAHVAPLPREALGTLLEQLGPMEQANGFLPNSILTMARIPGLPDAMIVLVRAVFMNGLIPPDLAQLVAHVASTAAGCRYCQAHTGHAAERLATAPQKLAAAWEFETSELFDDAERAAMRLAFQAGAVPNCVTAEDFADLRRHFDDDQIAAIVAVISLFGFLNRWNDTMATELEGMPRAFGERVLAQNGWDVGKHASAADPVPTA
jgi:alkylhydroperoxidase family enzyme